MKKLNLSIQAFLLAALLLLIFHSEALAKQAQARHREDEGFVFSNAERFGNPSFELIQPGAEFPQGFRVNVKGKDQVTVVNDYEQAFHGNICLEVNNPSDGYTWLGSDAIEKQPLDGKATLAVWLKGKGEFVFMIYNYHKTHYLGSMKSPPFKVNSGSWKKFSWQVDIPKTMMLDGQAQSVTKVGPLFLVKGKVDFDKLSFLQQVDQKNIETRMFLTSVKDNVPMLSIPRLSSPPTIDGDCGDAQWANAAMTTGFHVLGENVFSDRQTHVQMGYDDDFLYLSLESVRGRVMRKEKETKKDIFTPQTAAYEIWINNAKDGWIQILVTEFDGLIIQSQSNEHVLTADDLEYKSRMVDSGSMKGGTLTFEKNNFSTEIKIPFKSLGMEAPKPGDALKINFCSDMAVDQGGDRKQQDWTTWTPLDRFNDTANFGQIVFSDAPLAVQINSVGDLNNAGIAFSGKVKHAQKHRLGTMAWVSLRGSGKVLFNQYDDLLSGNGMKFNIDASLEVKRKEDLIFHAQIGDLDSQSLLASVSIPFSPKPSFSIELVPDYAKGNLFVSLDTAKLKGLPSTYAVNISVWDKASGEVYATAVAQKGQDDMTPMVTMDLRKINGGKSGDYVVKCFLAEDEDGPALASALEYLKVPNLKQFVWLNNKWGITDKVLAPWKPVKVRGHHVEVTQRTYVLENSGLPSQVTALDENLFSESPQLRARVNGKSTPWIFDEFKKVKSTDAAVVWQVSGRCGPLQMQGTIKVEFDGFVLWTVQITSEQKAVINRLWLEFSFQKDRSLYARGANFLSEYSSKYYSCLFDYQPKVQIQEVAHTPISLHGGWPWPETFFNNLWIGDDARGIAFMTESDEFILGGRYFEIDQQGGANVLKYNFISTDVPIDSEALRYEMAYQATPVKPAPANPKLWHVDNFSVDKDKEGYQKRVHASLVAYWALHPLCYPQVYDASFLQLKNKYGKYGTQMLPYFGLNFVGVDVPEWEYFKGVWSTRPRSGWTYLRGKSDYVSTKSSFADYIVWSAKQVIDSLGMDGIYLDVSHPIASTSMFHGSGYEREGKRYPTVNIFALREVYKRIYNVYHSQGRHGTIYLHQTGLPAILGFADVTTEGEGWLGEGKKGYSRLTPEIFRVKDMRIQYGTPFTWYTSFNYTYRVEKYFGKGKRISAQEILAYSLPHHVMPAISESPMWPIWDALDPWWAKAIFVPYWSASQAIQSNTTDMYASLLVKKAQGKALILCGNWSGQDKQVSLTLHFAQFLNVQAGQRFYAKTVLGPSAATLTGDTLHFSLKAKNYAILEVGME